MGVWTRLVAGLRRLQWARGVRAGVAVAAAAVVCRMLGQPIGWAALGGFEAILVDNGGPYRSRLTTMATVLAGGAVACVVGAWAAPVSPTPLAGSLWPLALAFVVTAGFCFLMTFARVISQALASTSVIVIVLYFAGYGGTTHTLRGAMGNALAYVLGGAWAAALSLGLWPVDPFRPARLAVAECYRVLANFAASVRVTPAHSAERDTARRRTHEFQRTMRLTMEAARGALETTAARTTARTVRARNLTVLLETADLLFAESIRWVELLEVAAGEPGSETILLEAFGWMSRAERVTERGLVQRPKDGGASFAPDGSHSIEHVQRRAEMMRVRGADGSGAYGSVSGRRLLPDERDAAQNIEIAFEAVRAVWTGVEVRAGGAAERWEGLARRSATSDTGSGWLDSIRANWTGSSLMMRHALRLAVVGGVDVLLMRIVHLNHGTWLAMTSIIVLQPHGSGTLRKTLQRVVGTVAGAVVAAVLVALIPNEAGIIVVITLTSVLTLATFAVDYGWYTFFLTPTFVLMSLPQLRDWHYAGLRIGTTMIGALVAMAAMWLLWPEREQLELSHLLGLGAAADAAYVRAMLRFWAVPEERRAAADRELMAPARRRCGLAINDAEETLDRLMLEPSFGRRSADGKDLKTTALTFVTYLRRITRIVTTLEGVGAGDSSEAVRVEAVATRLEQVSAVLLGTGHGILMTAGEVPSAVEAAGGVAEQQIRRMERQAGVMERAAAEILVGRG